MKRNLVIIFVLLVFAVSYFSVFSYLYLKKSREMSRRGDTLLSLQKMSKTYNSYLNLNFKTYYNKDLFLNQLPHFFHLLDELSKEVEKLEREKLPVGNLISNFDKIKILLGNYSKIGPIQYLKELTNLTEEVFLNFTRLENFITQEISAVSLRIISLRRHIFSSILMFVLLNLLAFLIVFNEMRKITVISKKFQEIYREFIDFTQKHSFSRELMAEKFFELLRTFYNTQGFAHYEIIGPPPRAMPLFFRGISYDYVKSVEKFSEYLPGADAVYNRIVLHIPDFISELKRRGTPQEFIEVAKRERIKTILLLPIIDDYGNILGINVIYRKRGRPFNQLELNQIHALHKVMETHITRGKVLLGYKELFENVPIGLYRSTPEGKILDCNQYLVKMLGYPDKETLLGVDASSVYLDPTHREKWKEEMDKYGVVVNFRTRMKRYDGSVIWVSDNARAIRDNLGNVLYYEGSLTDITKEINFYERLTLVQKLISRLVGKVPLSHIYELAFNSVRELLGADKCGILVNDEKGIMRWRSWINVSEEYRKMTEGHNPWEGQTGEYEIIKVVDAFKDKSLENFYQLFEKEGIKSLYFIPLVYENNLWGKLMIYFGKERVLDDSEIYMLKSIAEAVALAITREEFRENLERLVEKRTKFLELLYNFTRDVFFAYNLRELVLKASDVIYEAIPYDVIWWILPSDGGYSLFLVKSCPISRSIVDDILKLYPEPIEYVELESKKYSPSSETVISLETQFMFPIHLPFRAERAYAVVGFSKPFEITQDTHDVIESIFTHFAQSFERLVEVEKSGLVRLVNVLNNIDDAVFVLDTNFRVLIQNKAAEELLKEHGEFHEGVYLRSLFSKPVADIFRPYLERRVQEIVQKERTFYTIYQKTQFEPTSYVYVVFVRDITKEKKMEEYQLEHEKFISLGQLSSGIAHDFNNLLQGIIGFAELILSDPEVKPHIREKVENILTLADGGRRSVEKILDIVRRKPPKFEKMHLDSFIVEMVNVLRSLLPENIEIKFEMEPDSYIIMGEPALLQQVIINLAVNAKDAMPHGGFLYVRLKRKEIREDEIIFADMEPGAWAIIEVEDTGKGIPKELIKRIFEPFFTTKPPGLGTGLGLTQVYGIIRQHGGFIDVESQVGKGSCFKIYLKIIEEGEKELLEEPKRRVTQLEKFKSKRIILVDDNPAVLEVSKMLFESVGFKVIPCLSAEEAIQKMDEDPTIPFLVTDLTMPKMSGIDLARELSKKYPNLKTVIVSGYPFELTPEIKKYNIVSFLPKPFRIGDIISAFEDLV